MLIPRILRKGAIRQHASMDLAVEQVVLGELDEVLCLS